MDPIDATGTDTTHGWYTVAAVMIVFCMRAKLLQSGPILCDPMGCSPPGSSVHGILRARILECVACPPPGNLPDPRMESLSHISCLGRQVLYH